MYSLSGIIFHNIYITLLNSTSDITFHIIVVINVVESVLIKSKLLLNTVFGI